MIIAVAGLPGTGKTTWIRQQLAIANQPVQYFSPGSDPVPIDMTCIAAEFPNIKILTEAEGEQLLKLASLESITYIELGFHVDLASIEPVLSALDGFSVHRVALMPPNTQDTGWHSWASEVVPGVPVEPTGEKTELWRAPISGQILDPASLDIFWYELTQGAYGKINRTKGIFELADGRAFYFDFVAGIPDSSYTELTVPRWLEGRPERFSGIEVLGVELDREAIAQTLKDCCLSDATIQYYQQQIKESLAI
ncbi:MAG: GTP-binding protein [Symploca sp. SIO1B1]|nr:GTP-binding protein [Symploca sp. SIO1B1]